MPALRRAWLLLAGATLASCGAPPPLDPFTDVAVTSRTVELYGRTCAICHAPGHGGAPRAGDVAAWTERVAQGEEVLLSRTIDGFLDMPPLGMCMDCERDDLKALIRFMAVPATAP